MLCNLLCNLLKGKARFFKWFDDCFWRKQWLGMQLRTGIESFWETAIAFTKYVFDGCFWKLFFFKTASIDWVLTGPGKYWNLKSVLESPGIFNFHKKSWKCPGILHNICLINFLFQVVHNEFLPSCYLRYSTSFFLVYLPVSKIKM